MRPSTHHSVAHSIPRCPHRQARPIPRHPTRLPQLGHRPPSATRQQQRRQPMVAAPRWQRLEQACRRNRNLPNPRAPAAPEGEPTVWTFGPTARTQLATTGSATPAGWPLLPPKRSHPPGRCAKEPREATTPRQEACGRTPAAPLRRGTALQPPARPPAGGGAAPGRAPARAARAVQQRPEPSWPTTMRVRPHRDRTNPRAPP
mmetsp:Transcript_49644/g.142380  ORF Transcript_49644/g.142380 Transcript_49644/m.142380 type:complete len:203 (+) Transcript_49644:108-716(+)